MKKQSGIKSAIRKTFRDISRNFVSAEHEVAASAKKMFKSSDQSEKKARPRMHKGHVAPPVLKSVQKSALLKSQKLRPVKTLSQRAKPFLSSMKKGFNEFLFVEKKAVNSIKETAKKDWHKLAVAEHNTVASFRRGGEKAIAAEKRFMASAKKTAKDDWHKLGVAEHNTASSLRRGGVRFAAAEKRFMVSAKKTAKDDWHKLSVAEHRFARFAGHAAKSTGSAAKKGWHNLSDAEHKAVASFKRGSASAVSAEHSAVASVKKGLSNLGSSVASVFERKKAEPVKHIHHPKFKVQKAVSIEPVKAEPKGVHERRIGIFTKLLTAERNAVSSFRKAHPQKTSVRIISAKKKPSVGSTIKKDWHKLSDAEHRFMRAAGSTIKKDLHRLSDAEHRMAEGVSSAGHKMASRAGKIESAFIKNIKDDAHKIASAEKKAVSSVRKGLSDDIHKIAGLESSFMKTMKQRHARKVEERRFAEAARAKEQKLMLAKEAKLAAQKEREDKFKAAEESRLSKKRALETLKGERSHEKMITEKRALEVDDMAEKKALKDNKNSLDYQKKADRLKASQEKRNAHFHEIAEKLRASLAAKAAKSSSGTVSETPASESHNIEIMARDVKGSAGKPIAHAAVQEAKVSSKVSQAKKSPQVKPANKGKIVFDIDQISKEIEAELKKGAIDKDEAQILQQRIPITQAMSGKLPPVCKKTEGKACKGFIMTGVPGLDALFEKGIPKGSTILIAGGAGSGKTILCLQTMFYHALGGEKCLYMSFEESEERLIEHMESFGWNAQSMIDKGRLMIKRFNPFDITRNVDALLMKAKGELLIDVEPVILPENYRPDFIVVDSLTAIASAFTGKEDSYRIYIEQLFRFFEKINATSFLITETKQIPTIFSQTGVEEFLADGVIVLYNIKRGNIRENAIEVLKLRGAKHEKKIVAMQLSDKGITVYPEQEVFGGIEETQ